MIEAVHGAIFVRTAQYETEQLPSSSVLTTWHLASREAHLLVDARNAIAATRDAFVAFGIVWMLRLYVIV